MLVDPRCADPLDRRSVRVSMGAALAVPFARLDPWPDGLGALRAGGVTVAALTPAGDVELSACELGRADRVAVIVGAEGPGLSAAALAAAGVRVRIATAAGIALYAAGVRSR